MGAGLVDEEQGLQITQEKEVNAMKLTVGELKRVVSEAFDPDEELMSRDEAIEYISAQDGEDYTPYDIVDEETGEVYLEKGDMFNSSAFHPEHKPGNKRAKKNFGRPGAPYYCKDCYEDLGPGGIEDHVCKGESVSDAYIDYHNALREFGNNWTDYTEEAGLEPSDVAFDAAEGFFTQYPEWTQWAECLDMTRAAIKADVADYVYDAMASGVLSIG